MKIKNKFSLLLFTTICIHASAQRHVAIPDKAFLEVLKSMELVRYDSLDTEKAKGLLQLNLANKGISNLNGIQYFKQLERLDCSNNKITAMKYFPPNLKTLNCSYNQLTSITNIPASLVSINISNNQLKVFPKLSANVQFFNYYKNPIPESAIPAAYKSNCSSDHQNCLPNKMIRWNILSNDFKKKLVTAEIKQIRLSIQYKNSWGKDADTEEINYYPDKNKYTMSVKVKNTKEDTTLHLNDTLKIMQRLAVIAGDMQLEKLDVGVYPFNKKIKLSNALNGSPSCGSVCSDCTNYSIRFEFISAASTYSCAYDFSSDIQDRPIEQCKGDKTVDVKKVIDWIYACELSNLLLPAEHMFNLDFFNKKNLELILGAL